MNLPSTKAKTAQSFPVLDEREWNFDAVPPEELAACCVWEYGRESRTVRETVNYVISGAEIMAKAQSAGVNPWEAGAAARLAISPRVRTALLHLRDSGHLQGLIRAYLARRAMPSWLDLLPRHKCPEEFSKRSQPIVFREFKNDEELMTVIHWTVLRNCMQYVTEVDWSQSNEQIEAAFKEWLKARRPKTHQKERRGRRGGSLDSESALQCLGVMRALHFTSFADRRFPEPFQRLEEKTIYKMRADANKRFHLLFPFLDKNELPQSWETAHHRQGGS